MSESRDALHNLIDSLPEEQVEQVLNHLRMRSEMQALRSTNAFAWVGSGRGPSDLSTNPAYLEGFGRD